MNHTSAGEDTFLSWIHFGDLHLTERAAENYEDFLSLVNEANTHLTAGVDFAFLPGDNADDGAEIQFMLVREGLDKLQLPVEIIAGDHDRASGSLDTFREILVPELYRGRTFGRFRLLFLNALDGESKHVFDLGDEQMSWIESELACARKSGLRPLIFTHLYPSELLNKRDDLSRAIRQYEVELVEMGHTHYNELANDGHTIYAATRSTGQIEEGCPGFSFTAINGEVISWNFKQWPFVLITSPADRLSITQPGSPQHMVRGPFSVRAKIWGADTLQSVTGWVDEQAPIEMEKAHGRWQFSVDSLTLPDGLHKLFVMVRSVDGSIGRDEITILVNQSGHYVPPPRSAIDRENFIGAYPSKGILGTQLGPNENGTKGPWPSWRKSRSIAF